MATLSDSKRARPSVNPVRYLSGRSLIFGLMFIVLGVVLVLLVVAVRMSFMDHMTKEFTWANYTDLYADSFVFTALKNTLGFSAIAIFVALSFATPIAFFAERTTLPGRGLIFPLMLITTLIPGFFSAMGWLLMFHPRIGMINNWAIQLIPGIDGPIFNVVSVVGMGIITGLGLTSLAFIMMAGSFRAMDPALEESAQIHGMGLMGRLRRISFPLVWPGILAAGLYVATIALASFDVPAFIGLSNRIFTFSTMMFLMANPEVDAPRFGIIGASSVAMIFIALLLSWWYLSVIRRSHRYTVVTGKNYRPKLITLNKRWIAFGWSLVSIKILFSFVIPLVMLVWASSYAAVWDRASIEADGTWNQAKAEHLLDVLTRLIKGGNISGIIGCGATERIVNGEFALFVFQCGDNTARELKDKGAPIDFAYIPEVANITHSFQGLVTNAKYPASAKLHMVWNQTEEGQRIHLEAFYNDSAAYEGNLMYDVVKEIESRGSPVPIVDLKVYTPLNDNVQAIKKPMKDVIRSG